MITNLLSFERRFIEKQNASPQKESIKAHYSSILQLLNPIVFKGKIIMNEYKFNLMVHLFNLCSSVDYIPTIFIKQIAKLSSFTTLEVTGLLDEVKNRKCTEFLSLYYKIVSVIMNNKFIKKGKKAIFEKIVSQKLNENTVKWLIHLFTQPASDFDKKTKILLKAITQTKFEFFDAFAVNFKNTICNLLSTSNQNKNWMNKYVFKIIEKCLIKIPNIEKEFLVNLSKLCHTLIDIFIKKHNLKIKKLYRLSMRIMYIIYDRRNEKNSKIIKFFKMKFDPLLTMDIRESFISDVLNDFIEVNFIVLNKRVDFIDFYQPFHSLLIDRGKEKEKDDGGFNNQINININEDIYLQCIEKIFNYEMVIRSYQISEVSFIRKLLNEFNSNDMKQNQISISIICRIINNCSIQMKIKILEEISFSNFSFFSEEENVFLLEKMIQAIMSNTQYDIIYDYFANYLNVLFVHSINNKYDILEFLTIVENVNFNSEQMFYLTLGYAQKFFIYLQESELFFNKVNANAKNEKIRPAVIKLLKIISLKSNYVKTFDKDRHQELLNIYSLFLIYKIIHFDSINFNAKFRITKEDEAENDFIIYLFAFANNIPVLIFNNNTFLTTPIKIEIHPMLISKLTETKKVFSDEFEDFEGTKNAINETDTITQLYFLCIYVQFVSKLYLLNILFDQSIEWESQSDIVLSRIPIEELAKENVSILTLVYYMTDNIFLCNEVKKDILKKIFMRFFEKYFSLIKKHHNTLFKQKLMSYDLKVLLNMACSFHSPLRTKAIELIKLYSNFFPFVLNEYDIFEYCVNVLGLLICYAVKHYGYYINDIKIANFSPLELPSEKKTVQQIFLKLYKIFEKNLQKSHMINNNNIAYNIANYMNQYITNPSLQREGMNYSVNLLQKLYNNIKKIEIPTTLKTSAYLDPEKFQNYLKTHVKKNIDKYTSISSINDIFSPSDYAKSTKLQLRNKYIGIVEGKINNLRIEFKSDDVKCYYKFMNETIRSIAKTFNESTDLTSLTKKLSPILIELTAFIVYADMDEFRTSFNKSIISDEIISILTSVPIFLNNSNAMEIGAFCWEWMLYLDKKKIPKILNSLAACLKNHSTYLIPDNIKQPVSAIFDLENSLPSCIIKGKEDYDQMLIKKKITVSSIGTNSKLNKPSNSIQIISETINSKCKNVSYGDYINGQITFLKFIKECMNEFCKCDIEKLKIVYAIIRLFVDLHIDQNLFRHPLYIYLHFLIFSIGLELLNIIVTRLKIFSFSNDEVYEFKILTFLYGLRYFEFDKERRIIESKFQLAEIEQTLINCMEILHNDINKREEMPLEKKKTNTSRKSNREKVYSFVYSIQKNRDKITDDQGQIIKYENFKELLIFLIDNEMNSLRYWNNPSSSHKNKFIFSEEKTRNIFEIVFTFFKKLAIKLIQRFPWINAKYSPLVNQLAENIYAQKKVYYHQPLALKILVDYIINTRKDDLSSMNIMNELIFWTLPSLNYALKFISLYYDNMFGLHKFCVYMMQHAMTKAIIFYLPQLIQSLRTNTQFQVAKFILKKCKRSTEIAHQFLWALEVEEVMGPKTKMRFFPKGYTKSISSEEISSIIRMKIIKNFNVKERKFWLDENEIFSQIAEVSACFLHIEGKHAHLSLKMTKEQKTEFVRSELSKIPKKIQPYIYLPTNPNYKIVELKPTTAVTLQSAKKVPFIVSFDTIEYPGPDAEYMINQMTIDSFIKNELAQNNLVSLENNNAIGNILSTDNKRSNLNTNLYLNQKIDNNSGVGPIRDNESRLKFLICNSLNNQENSNVGDKDCANYLNDKASLSDIEIDDSSFSSIENEQFEGVFIPTLEARALLIKSELVQFNEQGKEHLKEDKNVLREIRTFDTSSPRKADFFISPSTRNLLESEIEKHKGINLLNLSTKENAKEAIMNIGELNDCTLSDIDLSDSYIEQRTKEGKNQKNNNKDTITVSNDNKKSITMSCIFKVGDDLRQDALALQVIQIFQEIFNENNLQLYTFPYQTISTISPKHTDLGGFIEVVKDCDSRDQIGKTYDTNLYDYYLCSFGQENSNEFRRARKNLIESSAAYAIISYILQIKDRHNGNILIDKYGHLIHIDFGFIFDISPGGNMKFEKAAFKLTKEMIQIMQGTESEAFATFVDLTVRAFLACRDYMDKLLDPVVLMFSSGLDCFRENSIKNFVDRFKLEMNEEEAASYMRELISTAENNWRTNFYDYIQKKQNNISY